MGTSLFGLKPKNTYQALLKTTDNTAIDATLKTISDGLGDDTALQLSLRRVGVLTDSSVVTQVSSVIQSTTLNANLVIAPNGTGALLADIPDGLVAGGNARGANAVDLQMVRGNAIQVASGTRSVVVGGNSNRATAGDCVVVGGEGNTASGLQSFIGGGNANTSSSSYSTVSGGQSNTASTNTHTTVIGGQSNVASGQKAVAGGNGSTASGDNSVAIGISNIASSYGSVAFGAGCTASGGRSVAFGDGNIASGANSFVLAGSSNISSGTYAVSSGLYAIASLFNQRTISMQLNSQGTSQMSEMPAARSIALTTAATTNLSLDGTGVTNLIIPTGTNRAWNVTIKTIVFVSAITGTATGITVGDVYSENKYLLFKKVGGISSIVGTVETLNIKSTGSMNTANLIITAGASQEMAITFTAPTFLGGGSITCRIVSKIELSEVAYG